MTSSDRHNGAEDHGHHDHGDHDHGHGHGGPDAHFDARAADWDDEGKVERSRVVARALRDVLTIDDTTHVLEYGAGTGLATEQLAASGPVGPVVLVDPSSGMRDVMNAKVADGRLPADARVLDVDLAVDADLEATGLAGRIDLVVVLLALHHIPDVAAILAGLAAVLAPGGHVAIVDLDAEDGSFHAHLEDFGGHDGFTREALTAWLRGAGFDAPGWQHVHDLVKEGRSYPLFLAVAARAT